MCRPGWQLPLFITAEPEVKSHTAEILPISQTEIMPNFFHGHPTIYRSKEIKKAICSKCSLFTPSPFPKFSTKLKISLPPQKRAPYSFEGKSSSQIKAFDLTREKLKRNTAKSKLMIASCRKAISGRNVFPASNSILLLQLNLIQKRCISFKEPYFMQKKNWGDFFMKLFLR